MSPSGKARKASATGERPSPSSSGESKSSALPLRLSVARGGLGLELCEAVQLGPLQVEELEVELIGLNYPIDLSQGVKQFRNRRSSLRSARIRIDLEGLAKRWAEALRTNWGEEVRVRLRPVYESTASGKRVDGDNDSSTVPSLAVTVYRDIQALAFDLIVTAGTTPRLAIDAPRAVGHHSPPLVLAAQALDQGLRAAASQRLSMARAGRAVEMSGLAEALSLLVLPSLGCRLPEVRDQVVTHLALERGAIVVQLGTREQPFAAGRRALRVAGAADFLSTADQLLFSGELHGAREKYLESLEAAPGHADALQALAELDLHVEGRGESALSFLQELEAGSGPPSREAEAGLLTALAGALRLTGRLELALETLERALSVETDPVLVAVVASSLAQEALPTKKRRLLLDRAIAKAPFLRTPRRARFLLALQSQDMAIAASDAEQLEALQSEIAQRALVCVEVGEAYLAADSSAEGQRWLRRALRLNPDDGRAMLSLAKSLITAGESLRAAELLQTAARRFADLLESMSDGGTKGELVANPTEAEHLRDQLSQARFYLSQLLTEEGADEARVFAQLSGVETRSSFGVAARLMEAELFEQQGNRSRRDRALSRLLEAGEMGWVQLSEHRARLETFLEKIDENVDPSLVEFAERVLARNEDEDSDESA